MGKGKQRDNRLPPGTLVPQFSAPFTGPGKFPTGLSLINYVCWWSERGWRVLEVTPNPWRAVSEKVHILLFGARRSDLKPPSEPFATHLTAR